MKLLVKLYKLILGLYYLYLRNKLKKKQFFIFYNNMNFYKNIHNQHLCNEAYKANYIIRYVYYKNILIIEYFLILILNTFSIKLLIALLLLIYNKLNRM